MEIIPAILTIDPDEANALLGTCENKVKRVQIDILDGVFAPNKTISPEVFEDSKTKCYLDYHLMVMQPLNWVERCVAGLGDRLIGQVEHMKDQKGFVDAVHKQGIDAGLGLDIQTPVSSLNKEILHELDLVLVMSVKAGAGGQVFQSEALDKIKELNILRETEGYTFNICDDGGITLETIGLASRAGVDEVAIGRRIFEGNLEENIEHFKKAAMR